MPKTIEEIIDLHSAEFFFTQSHLKRIAQALKAEGYIHKNSIKRLDEKKVFDWLDTIFPLTETTGIARRVEILHRHAKAMCDKFSTEIKLPEKLEEKKAFDWLDTILTEITSISRRSGILHEHTKAMCDKFSTEIKFPEKKPELEKSVDYHEDNMLIVAENHGFNLAIDLIKEMNGIKEGKNERTIHGSGK
jgi:hypothetical protein